MATLKALHDVSKFTDSDPGRKRYAGISKAQYDAKNKTLNATDGKVAIYVPVEGNSCPSTLVPADVLKEVAKSKESAELVEEKGKVVVKVGKKKIAIDKCEDQFPNVYDFVSKDKPDHVFVAGVDVLKRIVEYAAKHGEDKAGITFGLYDAKKGHARREDFVRFFFRDETGQLVSGIFALCSYEADELNAAMETAIKIGGGHGDKLQAGKPAKSQPAKNGKSSDESDEQSEDSSPAKGHKQPKQPAKAGGKGAAQPAEKPAPAKPGKKLGGNLPRPNDGWPEEVTEHFHKAEEFLGNMRPALARRQLNLAKEIAEGSLAKNDTARKEIIAALEPWYAKVEEVHKAKKGAA